MPAEETFSEAATIETETTALPKKDDLTKIEGVGKKIAEIRESHLALERSAVHLPVHSRDVYR